MFDLQSFGRDVRRVRESRGLDRWSAADQIGVHWNTLDRIENARGSYPNVLTVSQVLAWAGLHFHDYARTRTGKR